MKILTYHFYTLDGLVDHIHQLFDRWLRERTLTPPVDEETLLRTKLVVHEWMANLVQHADFEDRAPAISVHIFVDEKQVRYLIEDNSAGFALAPTLMAKSDRKQALPDRGFGLQLIQACTEELCYDCKEGQQCLSFCVHTGVNPVLDLIEGKPYQNSIYIQ